MPRPRSVRLLALIALTGLALGVVGGATVAAFSWATSASTNAMTTDTDWTPPSAISSVIARSGSTTSGTISQGSNYFVYANVTDSGNPPSGVATVTANVSAITAGQTAAPLSTSGGPWTIDGTSYAYRSSSLTADNPLSAGTKSYSLTMSDAHIPANTATQGGFSVNVVIGPAGLDIQTTNGGTAHKPDAGDTVTYTYTAAMDPGSIMSGWTGSSTTIQARFNQNGCGAGNDSLTVLTPGGAAVNLGSVCLGGNFVNGTRTFTASTMIMSGNSVIVTLGGTATTSTVNANVTLTWTPSAAATDTLGNPCSTTPVIESGPADPDF